MVGVGTCYTTDIDGDVMIVRNNATTPDWSDCSWTAYGGTGKYAGVTGSGSCFPGGPFTKDGKNYQSSWTGEYVLP